MVAIVYQTDKRSGITYAYESISHWDKEKQQSRAKRKLIGRVDKLTGETGKSGKRNCQKNRLQNVLRSPADLFLGQQIFLMRLVRNSVLQMT